MKEIKLTHGYIALVNDEDYEYLNQFNWYAKFILRTGKYVAARITPSGSTVLMHREILKPAKKLFVDHIDGNPMNNQRENLRTATTSQINCKRITKKRAQYRGVIQVAEKFVARITPIGGKRIHLGTFETAQDAARAYNQKAIELHGDFANLNNI